MTIVKVLYCNGDDSPIRQQYVRMDVKYPTELLVNTCCETYKGMYGLAVNFIKGLDIMYGKTTNTIPKEQIERYMNYFRDAIVDVYEEKKHFERKRV